MDRPLACETALPQGPGGRNPPGPLHFLDQLPVALYSRISVRRSIFLVACSVFAADVDPIPPVKTSITVLERVATEAPASITVVPREQLQQQPGVNLDDRLRVLPGFSLFRRSSSLVAHPTTQGVSLRGLGSSGASRTLVLWDGIPLNDPFGGWVYWTRIDPEQIDRVEVSRGASTSVFGDRAMSGVLALFSRPARPRDLRAFYEGGNRGTHSVGLGGSHLWSRFAVSANTRSFHTDGYYIVPENRRGAVDRPANVEFVAGDLRTDFLGDRQRLFLKLDVLAEARENGTILTKNSTGLGTLSGNYSLAWRENELAILAYHVRERFHSTFSSISANRNIETLTFVQRVPSEAVGGAGVWKHRGNSWQLLGGGDFQRVEGVSTDRLVPSGLRMGGGSHLQHGVFTQANGTLGRLRLFGGLRHQYTGQKDRFWSPSAGVTYGRGIARLRGSLYRAYRAPTLNELYREFRVGNAVTRANPNLGPETMFGAEVGFDLYAESVLVTATGFRHEVDDIITNVTLSVGGGTIVRQRQNAASALARGVEFEVRKRWSVWETSAAYLFSDTRFRSGARVPQVPRHQGSAQLIYSRPTTVAALTFRSYSMQFEDDLNLFRLAGFGVLQLAVRQRLGGGLSAHLAVENALDRQYSVGFSPTPLVGAPRLWRAGLRWDGRVGR